MKWIVKYTVTFKIQADTVKGRGNFFSFLCHHTHTAIMKEEELCKYIVWDINTVAQPCRSILELPECDNWCPDCVPVFIGSIANLGQHIDKPDYSCLSQTNSLKNVEVETSWNVLKFFQILTAVSNNWGLDITKHLNTYLPVNRLFDCLQSQRLM